MTEQGCQPDQVGRKACKRTHGNPVLADILPHPIAMSDDLQRPDRAPVAQSSVILLTIFRTFLTPTGMNEIALAINIAKSNLSSLITLMSMSAIETPNWQQKCLIRTLPWEANLTSVAPEAGPVHSADPLAGAHWRLRDRFGS